MDILQKNRKKIAGTHIASVNKFSGKQKTSRHFGTGRALKQFSKDAGRQANM